MGLTRRAPACRDEGDHLGKEHRVDNAKGKLVPAARGEATPQVCERGVMAMGSTHTVLHSHQ